MAVPPQPSEGSNPPKREMPTFLKNMMSANQNIICTARGDDVKKSTMVEVLSQRLRIPIFQRRYCWGQDQWATLLSDALFVAEGRKEKHALGRITCVKNKADSRVVVIDGQQRNTTCSLLLAAIRDVCERRDQPADDGTWMQLASQLNSVLLPDKDGFATWLSSRERSGLAAIQEGELLDFFALVPTYCDRAAYFAAVLPGCASAIATATNGQWQRPMEAKLFFISKIEDLSQDQLAALADAVLNRLEWLFFPITVDDGYADGTEDVQVIFERLAARDATFTKPTRETEYASMGSADFVRNLLLGSFKQEADAICMYKEHWLPIEMAAAAASRRNQDSTIATLLESMLEAFLCAQPEKVKKVPLIPGVVGGDLYARFLRWFTAALEADMSMGESETEAQAMERSTTNLLKRLQLFSEPHLRDANAPLLAPSMDRGSVRGSALPSIPAGRPPAVPTAAKWRCTRCSFANLAGMPICTACMLKRP